MTAESVRGCGYRQPGGLYLVSTGGGVGCDRLPLPITPCACCGFAPSQTRSYQFVPGPWLGDHRTPTVGPYNAGHYLGRCFDRSALHEDPICTADDAPRLVMWVGVRYYTPTSFAEEANRLGVSKRITDIPNGLVLGKTWVLLAHPQAVNEPVSWAFSWLFGDGVAGRAPGIFQAFIPQRAELILHESQATEERVKKEAARGVSVVIVPDGAADARISWRPGEERPTIAPVAVLPPTAEVVQATPEEAV